MNIETLTSLALTLPDATRSEHFDSPDFRVSGKIFATLPSDQIMVLKLTPEQQGMVTKSDAAIFSPVDGGWGKRGWTNADIAALDEAAALSALIMAWLNAAPDSLKVLKDDMPASDNRHTA